MIGAFEDALQELKRVDHLFWVSLKYTRTVDVIRNTIQRLMNVYGHGLDCILNYAKDNGKITEEIPIQPFPKCDLIKNTFPDNKNIVYDVNFYLKLRKILKSEFTKREEFRRHVTMTVNVDGETIDVDIDLIKEYFDQAKDFIGFLKALVNGDEEI